MSERKLHLDGTGLTLILGCTLVWGIGQLASKVALSHVPPLTQAGWRSLGAGALVLAWARWRGIRLFERDTTLVPGLIAGALFAAEFAAVYSALRFTTAGRVTVFLYLAPFVVAIGMAFVARAERLSRAATWGLVAAFGGVVLAFVDGFTSAAVGPLQWWGDTLGVLAAIGWGATTVLVRATSLAGVHPAKTLLYQLAMSGVTLTGAGWLVGERPVPPFTPLVWGSLAFQIVVVASTSYLVWFWLVSRYAAATLSAFTLLAPIIALLGGAVLLGEPLTPRIVLATAAVCIGLVAVNRPQQRGSARPHVD